MSTSDKSRANSAASAALFAVILLVTVGLALVTDLSVVVRLPIAVASGVVVAAVVYSLVGRADGDSAG